MSLQAAQLFANVGLTGAASTVAGLKGVGAQVNATHTGMGRLGGAATSLKNNLSGLARSAGLIGGMGIGVALVGGLVDATKSAMSFNSAMELIKTQAGGTQQEVDSMSAALLKLAGPVGTSPELLAAGLYHVESAGLRGAKALNILTVAAEGAKVGHADLEAVTNALIAANQSGVKGVTDMAGAMGTLNAIVGSGNMRMQDLVDAMATGVLSTAKNYGVSLQSVGAALASMTDQGIPAVDAATRLNSAMRLMAAPTSKAVKELASIGLNSTQLAKDMRSPGGMLTAITDLKTHLDKSGLSLIQQAALIAGAFGGKQSGAILTLIGNVGLLGQKTAAVAAGASGFGAAWAASQDTAEAKLQKFQAALEALGVRVGNVLLPVVTDVLGGLTDGITQNADQITAIAGSAVGLARDIGHAFTTYVLPAFGMLAQAWGALPDPLKGLLVGGFVANKLTGGLVTGLAGDLAKTLLGKVPVLGGAAASALGVQHVWVDNMGAGGLGGGAGGAGGAAGGILQMLKTGLFVGIAAASVAALAYEMGQFLNTRDAAQAGLQAGVDAAKKQDPAATAANLTATVTGLQSMGLLDRSVALTFGGGQITQDLADAAKRLNDASLTSAQAKADLPALQKALAFAQYEKLDAAIGPLTDAIARLKDEIAHPRLISVPDKPGVGLTAVNQLSGGITGALGGGRLAASGALMAEQITGIFAKSTSPSLHSMDSALGQLRTMEARYLSQGDTALAAKLKADIAYLGGRVDAVTQAINAKQFINQTLTTMFPGFFPGDPKPVKPKLGPPAPGGSPKPVPVILSPRLIPNVGRNNDLYGPTVTRNGRSIA